ncbi:MAG: hypothetical protein M3N47_05905 [Chloroflexota bacterium]|nr:hypothetical protein [Chloroflexota bacterium]
MLLSLPACMALVARAAAIRDGAGAWAYVTLLGGAVALAGAGYAGLVMREMFAFGLLRYVRTGVVVAGFRENDLQGGIRPRPPVDRRRLIRSAGAAW